MLLQNIYELLDFSKQTDLTIVLNEFTHKFKHTIVKINDKLETIKHIDNVILLTDKNKYPLNSDTKIETFLPESGWYQDKTCTIFLSKLPQRQWNKSFSLDQTHKIVLIFGDLLSLEILNNYVGTHIIFNNKVYIYNRQIGKEDNGIIYLSEEMFLFFEKDIKELWPQYNISISAKNPPLDTAYKGKVRLTDIINF